MRHWKFWEWVAYATLAVAAVISAADAAFKNSPNLMSRLPDFFHSTLWGFVPAILVVLGTLILFLRHFVFFQRTVQINGLPTQEWHYSNRIMNLVAKESHDLARNTGDWEQAEADLYNKLRSGQLVSRGWLWPENELIAIRASEWRGMRFKKDTCFTAAEAKSGIRYFGIEVAKQSLH